MPSLFGRNGQTGTADESPDILRRACMSLAVYALGGAASSPVPVLLKVRERASGRRIEAFSSPAP